MLFGSQGAVCVPQVLRLLAARVLRRSRWTLPVAFDKPSNGCNGWFPFRCPLKNHFTATFEKFLIEATNLNADTKADSSHVSIVTSLVTSGHVIVASLVATLATSLVITFVKRFIMCLAAPLVTTLSRLPSRLSWRLPSCLLSCESSPLKSRLWS